MSAADTRQIIELKEGPEYCNQYVLLIDAKALLRRRRNVALLLLTLVCTFNYMDRMLLPALAHPIKLEFALSDTQVGLLTGFVFALFYAIVGLPLARLADIRTRRTIVAVSLAVWSAMTVACGLTQAYWQLLVARMGVGAGESGSIPASYSLVSDYFPPQRRALAFGILLSGTTLGITAGLALGGWLGSELGWRAAFVIVGAPGLLLAVVVRLFVHEPARPQTATLGSPVPVVLRALLSNRAYLWVAAGSVMSSFMVFGMAQWLPMFFIRNHGMTLAEAGGLLGLVFGSGMLIGTVAGGLIGDRLAQRAVWRPQLICVWSALALLPAYALVLWLPQRGPALLATFVATAIGSLQGPALLSGLQNVCEAGIRATASAISIMMNSLLGIGLAPLTIGMLSDVFAATAGNEALRHALTVVLPLNLLAAWIFHSMAVASRRRLDCRESTIDKETRSGS